MFRHSLSYDVRLTIQLVGIIIGAIVVLCLVALVVTRTIRKKARNRRTAHRTSMFEPWPAPVTMEDEDDLEKSRVCPLPPYDRNVLY